METNLPSGDDVAKGIKEDLKKWNLTAFIISLIVAAPITLLMFFLSVRGSQNTSGSGMALLAWFAVGPIVYFFSVLLGTTTLYSIGLVLIWNKHRDQKTYGFSNFLVFTLSVVVVVLTLRWKWNLVVTYGFFLFGIGLLATPLLGVLSFTEYWLTHLLSRISSKLFLICSVVITCSFVVAVIYADNLALKSVKYPDASFDQMASTFGQNSLLFKTTDKDCYHYRLYALSDVARSFSDFAQIENKQTSARQFGFTSYGTNENLSDGNLAELKNYFRQRETKEWGFYISLSDVFFDQTLTKQQEFDDRLSSYPQKNEFEADVQNLLNQFFETPDAREYAVQQIIDKYPIFIESDVVNGRNFLTDYLALKNLPNIEMRMKRLADEKGYNFVVTSMNPPNGFFEESNNLGVIKVYSRQTDTFTTYLNITARSKKYCDLNNGRN